MKARTRRRTASSRGSNQSPPAKGDGDVAAADVASVMAWVPSRSCRSEPTPPQLFPTNLAPRPEEGRPAAPRGWTSPRPGEATGVNGGAILERPAERVSLSDVTGDLPAAVPRVGPAPGEWRGEIRTSRGCAHGDPFHVGARFGRGAIAQGRVQALPVVQ